MRNRSSKKKDNQSKKVEVDPDITSKGMSRTDWVKQITGFKCREYIHAFTSSSLSNEELIKELKILKNSPSFIFYSMRESLLAYTRNTLLPRELEHSNHLKDKDQRKQYLDAINNLKLTIEEVTDAFEKNYPFNRRQDGNASKGSSIQQTQTESQHSGADEFSHVFDDVTGNSDSDMESFREGITECFTENDPDKLVPQMWRGGYQELRKYEKLRHRTYTNLHGVNSGGMVGLLSLLNENLEGKNSKEQAKKLDVANEVLWDYTMECGVMDANCLRYRLHPATILQRKINVLKVGASTEGVKYHDQDGCKGHYLWEILGQVLFDYLNQKKLKCVGQHVVTMKNSNWFKATQQLVDVITEQRESGLIDPKALKTAIDNWKKKGWGIKTSRKGYAKIMQKVVKLCQDDSSSSLMRMLYDTVSRNYASKKRQAQFEPDFYVDTNSAVAPNMISPYLLTEEWHHLLKTFKEKKETTVTLEMALPTLSESIAKHTAEHKNQVNAYNENMKRYCDNSRNEINKLKQPAGSMEEEQNRPTLPSQVATPNKSMPNKKASAATKGGAVPCAPIPMTATWQLVPHYYPNPSLNTTKEATENIWTAVSVDPCLTGRNSVPIYYGPASSSSLRSLAKESVDSRPSSPPYEQVILDDTTEPLKRHSVPSAPPYEQVILDDTKEPLKEQPDSPEPVSSNAKENLKKTDDSVPVAGGATSQPPKRQQELNQESQQKEANRVQKEKARLSQLPKVPFFRPREVTKATPPKKSKKNKGPTVV